MNTATKVIIGMFGAIIAADELLYLGFKLGTLRGFGMGIGTMSSLIDKAFEEKGWLKNTDSSLTKAIKDDILFDFSANKFESKIIANGMDDVC